LKYALWKIIKVQLQQGSQLYLNSSVRRIPNYCRRNKRTKDIGLVCIQHEFGLLAEYGDYVLILALNKPATIFHTVLPYPDENEKNCSCYSRFV
jgi:hypothetical protein